MALDLMLELFLGPVFTFVGLCAVGIAAIRRRAEYRVLLWFGLFIGMYGARILAWNANALAPTLNSPWPDRVVVFVDYMLIVPGLLFWVELSLGKLRQLIELLGALGGGIGILSLSWYFVTAKPYKFLILNNVIAICMLLVVSTVVVVPRLSRRYLVIQSHVLRVVAPAIAVVALFSNASWVLDREPPRYAEPIGFAVWTLALGYIALQRTFENERRLIAIESELQTARQIQLTILPDDVPSVSNLRIASAYHPMSAVAGDFYQFIQVDPYRVGVLVADVSGHGVPAALIAAMMKMAVQSVVSCVASPADVLQGLNRMLSGQAPDQFVTAAYLFIDTQNYKARYSAAGHPPLLLSRAGTLQRIESNGLVFGVTPQPDYPVRDIAIRPGDRLLLYTDGVIEAENANGRQFGDAKLEQVVLRAQMSPPSELTDTLLTEIRAWQPASMTQQDDITLVVIDVR
ncbi:MAG TPA: PP2C family protein-serine/threonine phosphatase [Candidatus Saccharimonadales bacterium]|nr:PP2C family protein-serine/threonine phosphatase [Candidatus Saccharimonadales bacterium]